MSRLAAARELGAMLSGRGDELGDPRAGWAPVLDLAAEHRLLAGLGAALRERGVPQLPAALAGRRSPLTVLEHRYRTNVARVGDLRRRLAEVVGALAAAGIDAIPIKGGHLMVADILRDPAARETIDLDILVPGAQARRAEVVLRTIGYWSGPVTDDMEPSDHQLGPLYPPSGPGSVEIHLEPIMARYRPLVTATEVRRSAIVHDDAVPLPDATTAICLLIGHAQLQDNGSRLLELPLRALHDLHQLDPAFVAATDWDEVTRRFLRLGHGGRVALAGFAAAARSYIGIDLPVPTVGGIIWLRAAEAALDRPRRASLYRQVAYLPIALGAERMARLHHPGAERGAALWSARAHHVAAGAARRVRARTSPPPSRSSRRHPTDNGVPETLDRTVINQVVDHGDWHQVVVTLPPFHWRIPSGLDATSEAWFWKQDENMRHFIDTRSAVNGVVRVVDDGVFDGRLGGESTQTHHVGVISPPHHTSAPEHECAMYVAGPEIEYFQHFLDIGVPHIALMLMATGAHPRDVVIVTRSWTTDSIPAILERWGFKAIVAATGPVSARTLILPERVPRVHPLFYERFRNDMRFADGEAHLVVLVSRTATDTTKRTRIVTNQDALAAALRSRFGERFVVFRPATSTFAEAAALFGAAALVIGMHGGAMYNAMFSSHSTTIVELMPVGDDGLYHGQGSGRDAPPFAHLAMYTNAMLLGQPFYRFYSPGPDGSPIDVDRFMHWLESVPAAASDTTPAVALHPAQPPGV